MAGFTTNKKTNHEIENSTGYVRAGQGGVRHRFAGKLAAPKKPKAPPAPAEAEPDADDMGGEASGLGAMSGYSDNHSAMDSILPDHPMNQEVNGLGDPGPISQPGHAPAIHPPHNITPHAPVQVHIHLGPADHKAFKTMARKPRK